MSNPTGKGGFQTRKHQINKKGRPRSFDALRELAQAISHEEALSGGQPLVVNGKVVTVAEAILRQWFQSKNPVLQMRAIEIAFGKVPNPVELSGKDGGPVENVIRFEWVDATDSSNPDAPAA